MKLSLTALIAFFALNLSAQTLQQNIEKAYATFEQDPQFKYGTNSLTVLNAETGEVIFSKNGNTGLAPASTLKTITSATAYYLLGPEFTWKTSLGYSGQIKNGTLNGDLVLSGGGDPTLGSWRYEISKTELVMKKWVQAIREAGIKKVNGRILADDQLFGSQSLPSGWIWQDMGNYYGAGPNSLTWNENQFDLIFKPGNKVGDEVALVRTEPVMTYLKIINEVKTGSAGSGDNVYAYSSPYSNLVYLRGTYGIDLKKNISASVPDPAFDVAWRLRDTLMQLGISVEQPATSTRQLAAEKLGWQPANNTISAYTSPTLSQVVYWFNQKSINLYGEHLIKTLAWKQDKEITTAEGARVIKDFWSKKLNMDAASLNIIDGSGLSPGNRVTTMSMARILQSVKSEPWFKTYLESFPLYNNMKMKSGTINGALAYTGYQTSSSGVPLVFSFIVNNYNGSSTAVRQKMFQMLDVLK
ncbi:MAG TPA: D-alanyl-D-alanine carboxypeptidase/D-alanyl-D-alanine-endopeptidase [Daejeonella sp.]|nr:D-alanyl-D-alanine carboxypeptidase/D-alanyl-D-alanine-endopeptidase [Daejeonella sp.]